MPRRPPAVCSSAGCRRVAERGGKCEQCRTAQRQHTDAERGRTAQRGYGGAHRRFRSAVLARDPVCRLCGVAPATVADHYPTSRRELVARGLDPNDPACGRGLCAECDHRQTARRQPGGFNR